MKTFTLHWRIWSTLQSCTVRNGYTVLSAPNKRTARTLLRDAISGQVSRGEKIVVDNIAPSSWQ